MTESDLHALVRMLQEQTPLRTVFELMLQRGYTITKPKGE
jgi:hypothetical protein